MQPLVYAADGITYILCGLFFFWLGLKQKSPKKFCGLSYRLYASLVGAGFVVFGLTDVGRWLAMILK